MNEDQVKAFSERLNDKIETKYQDYLKDKLDLIFCGPDGISRPNNMAHKMQQVLTKKWKVEPISTVDKLKLKEKVQKKIRQSIKFVSDFHGGYAIIAVANPYFGPSYNIINKDGELQLRNNFHGEAVMLMGHILLKNRYNAFIFDEIHDGETRYYTTIDGDFHEGLARVHKSRNFMTDDGELFFARDLHYGEFSDFHEGYARYKCGNTVDYVDHNGKCLFGSLNVKEIHQGKKYKLPVLDEILKKYDLTYEQVSYMGDDLPDICILEKVGLATCSLDAVDEVKRICHFISTKEGGRGAVRELTDLILKAQGIDKEYIVSEQDK